MRIISITILTFALSSCSVVKMSDVAPCTKGTDFGQVVLSDQNTGFAPVLDAKSVYSGKAEVVGYQVYHGKQAARPVQKRSYAGGGCGHGNFCAVGNSFPFGGSAFGYGGGYHSTSFRGHGVGPVPGVLPGVHGYGLTGFNQINQYPPVILNSGSVFNGVSCGGCGGYNHCVGGKTCKTKTITAPAPVTYSAKGVISEQEYYEIQK